MLFYFNYYLLVQIAINTDIHFENNLYKVKVIKYTNELMLMHFFLFVLKMVKFLKRNKVPNFKQT